MKRSSIICAALVAVSVLGGAGAARAQSLNQQGIARLNADAQQLWTQDGIQVVRPVALAELQKLVGIPHQVVNSQTHATIIAVNSLTLDCPSAPGLTRCDGSAIEGRLPLSGSWRLGVEVRVRVKGKIAFVSFEDTFNVQLEVKDLVAAVRADLDSSDLAAPRIVRVHPTTVAFNIKITSANTVVQFLGWITRATVNPVASVLATAGARFLAQKLNVQTLTPQVFGAGGPGLAPVALAELEGPALRLEDQIERYRKPFGTVFEMRFDRPYHGTWGDSLADPSFDPGTPNGFHSWGDSALMTGDYMAQLAFRYAATRSTQARERGRALLRATRQLLTMKPRPGDLARAIMPVSALPGEANTGDHYPITYQGTDYIMSDYISRDAYKGIFFGVSLAHDLFDDPAMKDEARQQIEMAIDYLLANNWTWRKRDGSFGERWQGALEHQYGWVLAARQVNPAKYAAVYEQYKGFADLLWVPIWGACLDTYYSYYKFGLGNAGLYTALRLETDPARWMRAYQAIAITRRFIGHHQNAHFNNYYLALDPSAKGRLGAENANLLTRWLRSPRRRTIVDITGDPTIEKTTYTVPFDTNLLFPGQGVPGTVTVAKYPIPLEKRIVTGWAWSCSPFRLKQDYSNNPDPYVEGETLDYTLPYWMARYYRAIATPRRPQPAPVAATSTR